jgi:hypothetical protein
VFPQIRAGTELAQRPIAEVRAYLLANLTHVHTIAADDAVAARLATIRPGQLVRFSGILVDVTAPSGARYTSSTTLHDYDCESVDRRARLIDRGGSKRGPPRFGPVKSAQENIVQGNCCC